MTPLSRISAPRRNDGDLAGPASLPHTRKRRLPGLPAEHQGRRAAPGRAGRRSPTAPSSGLTPDQKVIDLDSRQPEFSLTYGKYIGQRGDARPHRQGPAEAGAESRPARRDLEARVRRAAAVHRGLLGRRDQLRQLHGRLLSVVRSVATLACMTKRTAFFSNETVQALRILANNHMTTRADARLVGRRHGQHAVHALDLHEVGGRSRRQRPHRHLEQPARRLRLGGQLPARHRLQARPAVERGGVPAAGLPARPGRHHGREAGARLGGDGRQASRRRRRCRKSTSRRRSSCRPAGAAPPSSSIRTSRR